MWCDSSGEWEQGEKERELDKPYPVLVLQSLLIPQPIFVSLPVDVSISLLILVPHSVSVPQRSVLATVLAMGADVVAWGVCEVALSCALNVFVLTTCLLVSSHPISHSIP